MGSYRHRWIVAAGVVVALLALPVLGAGLAEVGIGEWHDGGSATESAGMAAGSSESAETLGPPNWPSEPLDPSAVPGRYDVSNATEYPYATVGTVGSATGVMVSEYHVLTAAHVVTDADGDPYDTGSMTFTPGYRHAPDEPAEAPFGRANVTEMYVHPEWNGDPPVNDLALLVLDRPIGADAGSMALPDRAPRNVHSRNLHQAGYVHNVSGTRQIGSTPTPQPSSVGTDDGYHYYCGPLSHGDSGSPIWTDVDGRATLVSINSAWDSSQDCEDAAVGVRLDEQRLDLIRNWMRRDDPPESNPDTAVESGG